MPDKRVGIELVIDSKGNVKIRQAGKELTDLGKKGNKASKVLNKGFVAAGKKLDQFSDRLFSAKTALAALAGAAGLGYLGKSFIDASAKVEAFEARLISLTKSEELAQQKLQYMLDYAKRTPFELQGIFEAGVQAEAFGMKIEENMQQLGDLAAFMGIDIPEAAAAMGRAYAAGAGAADILRERGVLQLVKDMAKLKYGIEDITKLTLPEFRHVLLEAISDPMGKISGSTERLAKTFNGQMSMMSDAVFNLKRAIGEALMPVVQELLENRIVPLVKELEVWARANQDIIQQKFEDAVNAVVSAANELMNALPEIVDSLEDLKGILPTVGGLFKIAAGGAYEMIGAIQGSAGIITNNRDLIEQAYQTMVKGSEIAREGLDLLTGKLKENQAALEVTKEGAWDLAQAYENMGDQAAEAPVPTPSAPAAPTPAATSEIVDWGPSPKEFLNAREEGLQAEREAQEDRKALLDEFALYGKDAQQRELTELGQWYEAKSGMLENAVQNDLVTLSEYREAGLALEQERQQREAAIINEGLEDQNRLKEQFATYGLQGRDLELAELKQWYDEQQKLLEESGMAKTEIEGRNLTMQEALREEYINRLKEVETDFADYSIAELQRMLANENLAGTERERIWREVRQRIEKDQVGAWDSFTLGFQDAVEQFGNNAQQMMDLGRGVANSLESNLGDALYDFASGTKSAKEAFGDMAKAVVQDIGKMVARMAAMQAMQGLVGLGGMAFAEGGIMPGHFTPITPMQHGGVYSRPTLGLIAEAGTPEAVVPLKGGGVPVRFEGDRPQVKRERPTYIVNAFSEEFMQQQINKAISENAEVIVNMVQQDIDSQGSTYQLIRGMR